MTAGSPIVLITKPIQFHNRTRLENQIPRYNPTRVGMKGPATKTEVVSEYQGAYKKWPFQRPPGSIRPELRRMDIRVSMESNTTYKRDFVRHQVNKKDAYKERQKKEKTENEPAPPKGEMYTKTTYNMDFAPKKLDKTESFKPKCEYNMSKTKFKGQSIYQASYQPYPPEMAEKCRPVAKKPQENLEVPKRNVQFHLETTVQNDYQKPDQPETTKPIIPEETTHIAEVPMETTTIYQQYYSKEMPQEFMDLQDREIKQYTKAQKRHAALNSMTTYMADFKPHYNVACLPCCKPAESDQQFVDAPFEGQTTQRMAYKEWPVTPPTKPIWALKKPYKRSTQEVPMHSTYTVDFKEPSIVRARSPIKPKGGQEDIIKHGAGDVKADTSTTYQSNFKNWKGSTPAKSFLVKQVYVSPTESMVCESTQRSHYKGVQTERAEIFRKISEHRELNLDKRMYFNTTYKDTYTDGRPKSCPAGMHLMKKSPSVFKAKEAFRCTHCKSNDSLGSTKDSGIDTMASEP